VVWICGVALRLIQDVHLSAVQYQNNLSTFLNLHVIYTVDVMSSWPNQRFTLHIVVGKQLVLLLCT